MEIPSLLRSAEHRALGALSLDGSVLDLGGDARSSYRSLIRGEHAYTSVNLSPHAKPEILHDLEQPLPLEDGSFDHALLINVLEHVFNYRGLLAEAARVVRPGGSIVVVVPFLFPLHPSPKDFFRFSLEALERECALAGLSVSWTRSLGSGVFAARFVLLDRLLPGPLRLLASALHPVVALMDALFARAARMAGKKYRREDYALGYALVANKV